MEEWISLNEYMRRYKTGYEAVKKMIANKEVECRMTPGGYYKIRVRWRYSNKGNVRNRKRKKN